MSGILDPVKKHNEIRKYIDGKITGDMLKNLKDSVTTQQLVEPKKAECFKDFSDLFNELSVNGEIGIGKYDTLINLFEMNGYMALAKYLKDAQTEFQRQDLPKPARESTRQAKDVKGFTFNESSVPQMGKDRADPDNLPQDPDTRGSHDTEGREVEDGAKGQLVGTKDNMKSTTECDTDDMKEGLPSSHFQEASGNPPSDAEQITQGLARMAISAASTVPQHADDRAEETGGGNQERSSIGQLPQQEKDSSKTTTECDMKEGLPSSQFQGERPTQCQPSQRSYPPSAAPPAPSRPTAEQKDVKSEPAQQGDLIDKIYQKATVTDGATGNVVADEVRDCSSTGHQPSESSLTGITSAEGPPPARRRVVNQEATVSGCGSIANIVTGKYTIHRTNDDPE